MRRYMRFMTALATILLLAQPVTGESLRGPLSDPLVVTPVHAAQTTGVGLEWIVLIGLDGDPRFIDAIDIELTTPPAAGDYPGALVLSILGPVNVDERTGVADVVGQELLRKPLERGGKTFYQIVLRAGSDPDTSPAVTRVGAVVPAAAFPLALSVVPRMKGLSEAVQDAEFAISVVPVTRDIAAIRVRYVREDGSVYDAQGALAPNFALTLDGQTVGVDNEYLVQPGLRRLRLLSSRYEDQEVTVGVDRGRSVTVDIPLRLSLATVHYDAPRGASVYVNGSLQEGATGVFTVPPGEHTIVVVVGDYTVTRRFRVEERRSYSVSIVLDIAIEEIK